MLLCGVLVLRGGLLLVLLQVAVVKALRVERAVVAAHLAQLVVEAPVLLQLLLRRQSS